MKHLQMSCRTGPKVSDSSLIWSQLCFKATFWRFSSSPGGLFTLTLIWETCGICQVKEESRKQRWEALLCSPWSWLCCFCGSLRSMQFLPQTPRTMGSCCVRVRMRKAHVRMKPVEETSASTHGGLAMRSGVVSPTPTTRSSATPLSIVSSSNAAERISATPSSQYLQGLIESQHQILQYPLAQNCGLRCVCCC